MKHTAIVALVVICSTFFSTPAGMAEASKVPDVGPLGDDAFVLELDALCGVGKKLAQGCQAIREREIVDASMPPWRAIGRVNFASTEVRQHCTGTLLSERIVLTASHCLYNFPRKSWIPAQSIRFVAGYQRGAGEAVSEVARYIVDPVQNIHSRDFRSNFSQDWALLVLKDPIGRETGFLTPHSMDTRELEDTSFLLAGYAALRPHVLSVAGDCGAPENSVDHRLIFQKCSVMHGDSGAPVLAHIDGEEKVIGVFSGTVSNQSEFLSISIPISNLGTALRLELNWESR
ncbi:trypsin-like serine protease [Rhodobacteraceae bacterium M382]|nr:trypsin-like serine protease [Rhodobacteraceae bacterium M382]